MRFIVPLSLSVLAAASAGSAAAPRVEHWTATSTTAMGITGDISLSPSRLVAAGKVFPLAVSADVKDFGSNNGPQAARILKVTHPMDPVLRNGNRLCGAPVRWIAVYRSDQGKSLNLSVFSGTARPTSETGNGICGTFLYSR